MPGMTARQPGVNRISMGLARPQAKLADACAEGKVENDKSAAAQCSDGHLRIISILLLTLRPFSLPPPGGLTTGCNNRFRAIWTCSSGKTRSSSSGPGSRRKSRCWAELMRAKQEVKKLQFHSILATQIVFSAVGQEKTPTTAAADRAAFKKRKPCELSALPLGIRAKI
ncbi:uncharacterized protein PgNI_04890 [Pyricularia grisea]|uniref:Uncharacterized protein n=1 Tax=Pyricularia grisea TaxID=148305 RepID=A0A6P8B8Y4_PYRGI|nr:uncharacterized protein PgNI_04890 [Pyricularia grisea]TLD12288.1 hypothetical protein PgNI_04890 [Pyricularia grisea]